VLALATVRPAFAGLARLASVALDAADRASTPDEAGRAVRLAVDRFVRTMDRDILRIVGHTARRLGPGLRRPTGEVPAAAGSVRVLTISASSLVEQALLRAGDAAPLRVTCLESRPMLEGAVLARRLARAGLDVTLTLDALGPSLVGDAHMILLGGDTLAPTGLLHKVGTFGLALAASRAGVPVYALVGPEKLLPALLPGALDAGGTPDGLLPPDFPPAPPPSLSVRVPYFDLTPLDLLTAVVMPDGLIPLREAARLASAVHLHPL